MADDQVLVLLHNEVVGVLYRHDAGENPSFTYLPEYVRDGSIALSARLPIAEKPYEPDRVAPFLAGLLPENRETRQQWARRLGTNEDDLFTILASMGWDCPGAVQFCRPADLEELSERESSYEPVDEAGIAQRLRSLADDPASWTLTNEHWSLGGQQEKFAIASLDGEWYEARGGAATTHIVKPGIKALHHQALVEHATMAAASSLDVDIVAHQLMQFEDQRAIVVARFDRYSGDDGFVTRLHQEDFCQALGRLPDRKYEARGGPTLADMVRTNGRQSSSRHDDLLALADFVIINVIAGAPDGHSKNISMLRAPGLNSIAPLYDLATGLVYDTDRVERTVAVSVGGERQFARIYAKQWNKAARVLRLPEDAVRGRVAQLAMGFPDAYEAALADIRGAPGVDEVAERSLPLLKAHCEQIIARL